VTIDDVTIRVSDYERSRAFYDAVLEAVGLRRNHESAELQIAELDDFSIAADGRPVTSSVHVAFAARDRGEVEAFATRLPSRLLRRLPARPGRQQRRSRVPRPHGRLVAPRERGGVTIDMTEAARAWVEGWSRAWPIGDTETVAALYADGATFHSHPFREHQEPREYAEWAFREQAHAECRFGMPVVSRDRAAVDWWAVIRLRDGADETVAGTSLLRFDTDGRVVDQRDAWASRAGRHELPHWAAT
jgi:catechol 2,3-dioxygenase-like lactoylglutathione lyase family enzyme